MYFEMKYTDNSGWWWVLFDKSGARLCTGEQTFDNRKACLASVSEFMNLSWERPTPVYLARGLVAE